MFKDERFACLDLAYSENTSLVKIIIRILMSERVLTRPNKKTAAQTTMVSPVLDLDLD